MRERELETVAGLGARNAASLPVDDAARSLSRKLGLNRRRASAVRSSRQSSGLSMYLLDRCICGVDTYRVIRSFKDRETERICAQLISKRLPPDIQSRALTKLLLLDSAERK